MATAIGSSVVRVESKLIFAQTDGGQHAFLIFPEKAAEK